jgi:hypothetical protein
MVGTRDFSNPESGIDSSLHYRSADNQVTGTVYVYLPGLAHPGLAAYATEQGLRANSNTPVRLVRSGLVRAGNVDNAAVRADYENYRGGYSSSAAFIHTGRWMIKIRVSAPDGRRAEVDAAMEALLGGIRFGRQNPPGAASPIAVADCPAGAGRQDARPLPDPAGAEIAAHAMLATFDGAGILGTDEAGRRADLPSRVPPELCLSSRIGVGQGQVPILRAADGPPISVDGRTRLVALISDSGTWLEVVHAANLGRYLMLFHQVGSTSLLGGYDGVPSDRQIADLLSNPQSEAGRVRVPVTFRPDGRTEMHLPDLAPEQPRPTT